MQQHRDLGERQRLSACERAFLGRSSESLKRCSVQTDTTFRTLLSPFLEGYHIEAVLRGNVIHNVFFCICQAAFCILSTTSTKTDALLRLAQKGPVRARDLDEAGIPRAYLKRLCERGLLEQVDRGLYRLADAPVTELSSVAEVAKRVPHGIVCLLSALQIHGMTTEVPHAVWLLLDRRARLPRLAYPKLEVVRASGVALEHGVEKRTIEGVDVHITTPAKTVADCFRFRRHVGMEVALAALKDYLGKRLGSIDALLEAARADRVSTIIRPYLEALA